MSVTLETVKLAVKLYFTFEGCVHKFAVSNMLYKNLRFHFSFSSFFFIFYWWGGTSPSDVNNVKNISW
jgi:hypothetical protein